MSKYLEDVFTYGAIGFSIGAGILTSLYSINTGNPYFAGISLCNFTAAGILYGSDIAYERKYHSRNDKNVK